MVEIIEALKNQDERLKSIENLLTSSKTVLNLDEVCTLTGLSKSHVYKRSMLGTIPHYKQAKHLFFDRVEIENWLKENRIKTAEDVDREAATFVTLKNRRAAK